MFRICLKKPVIPSAILFLFTISCNDQKKGHDSNETLKTTESIGLSVNKDYPFDDTAGFTQIFNGQNLIGWQMRGKGFWEVQQGEIVGRQDPSEKDDSWLFTTTEWSDFVLQLEFNITPKSNSGIAIRMPIDSTGSPDVFGYEVQISDLPQRKLTGSLLHHFESTGNNLHHPDEWNQMTITCEDNHIKVYLNREKILDRKVKGSRKGRIGLQVPNGTEFSKQVVRFRNIRIKDL